MKAKNVRLLVVFGIIFVSLLDQTDAGWFEDFGKGLKEEVGKLADNLKDTVIPCRVCSFDDPAPDKKCGVLPPDKASNSSNSTSITTAAPNVPESDTIEQRKKRELERDIGLESICIRYKGNLGKVGEVTHLSDKIEGVCFAKFWENGTMMASGCTDKKMASGCEAKDGVKTCHCDTTIKNPSSLASQDPRKIFEQICNVKNNPEEYKLTSGGNSPMWELFLILSLAFLKIIMF